MVRLVCRSCVVARFWGIVGGLACALAVWLGGFGSRCALSRVFFASVALWRVRGCNCWALGLSCALGQNLRLWRLRLCCAVLAPSVSALICPRCSPSVPVIAPRGRSCPQGMPLPYLKARAYGRCYHINPRNEI